MNTRPLLASAARALLTKRAATNAIVNSAALVRHSSYYKPAKSWYPPHLDELPVPQGSWKAEYDSHQKKYNMHLLVGVTFFIFTLGFIKTSGIIFFNAFPPELPVEEVGGDVC